MPNKLITRQHLEETSSRQPMLLGADGHRAAVLHSQQPDTLTGFPATWRSGYAAACKAVYTGSIPVVALCEQPANGRI
jgi:hypothetical protein